MQTTQELNVWYILPAIRKELTMVLKEKNISQKEIARVLDVTEPAISQYMKNKRASTIVFPLEIKKEILKAAENMIQDNTCQRFELERLMESIKKSGFLCKIHREHDDVPDCCGVCTK